MSSHEVKILKNAGTIIEKLLKDEKLTDEEKELTTILIGVGMGSVLKTVRGYDMDEAIPSQHRKTNIATQTLKNVPKGAKIAILKTDSREKPLIIKTLQQKENRNKAPDVQTVDPTTIAEIDPSCCPKCNSNKFVIKRGFRYNKSETVQRYFCKKCGIKFSNRTVFKGMKNKIAAIVSALDLYFRGISLRQIAEHLELTHGIKVSHGTIHNWVKRYVDLYHRRNDSAVVEART